MSDYMLNELNKILERRAITSLYQPIIEKYSGEIFAYEALSRGPSDSPLHSPNQLFEYARQFNLLSEIESLCREKAVTGFVEKKLPGKLFINITPESLEESSHETGKTLQLLENLGMPSSQLVIELTEQFPSTNEESLLNALKHYQRMGLSIALDDLGAGYSSLRLWSQSRPEFVKIDRHFIQDIDLDIIKQEFVRSFVEIAKSMHCKVIAEGIETEAEFQYLSKLSIEYFQGYYFCRPQSNPPSKLSIINQKMAQYNNDYNLVTAKSLSVHKESIGINDSVAQVSKIFQDKPNINSIAVVNEERVLGLVSRTNIQGKLSQPFGRELYSNRKASEVMLDTLALKVDASLSIEQVSRLVTSRTHYQQKEDFVICQDEKLVGVGHVIDLLKRVTELQVNQARQANPLTQLPGLIAINDCIDQLIASNNRFIIAHFDIDNFKPFNDIYGFAQGDQVILSLSISLQKFSSVEQDTVGHIGGDDFITIYNSDNWQRRINDAIVNFDQLVRKYYYQEHLDNGGFYCEDRYQTDRFHPIASISVAVLEIEKNTQLNHFDISSRLLPLKHAAKSHCGNSLIVNDVNNYFSIKAR